MDEITRLRHRIDLIDREIIGLIGARLEAARLMGETKRARGLALRDPEREKGILQNVKRLARREELSPGLVHMLFRLILRLSVHEQGHGSRRQSQVLAGSAITIVGGTGGMGRFFARFAAGHGASVRIAGRNPALTRRVAEELGVAPGTDGDVSTSDIVIAAVPMEVTKRVCLKASRNMRTGSLLMDVSSVKRGISDRIANGVTRRIEYVSLHPLFGPEVDRVRGQDLVAIPYREGRRWREFSRALQDAGARVHMTTAESHDKAMAYVQGLHHFALISLGLSLKGWDGSYTTSSLRGTLERIRALLENWETIAGIQQLNPFVEPARKEFAKVVSQGSEGGFQRGTLRQLRSNVQKWSRKQ